LRATRMRSYMDTFLGNLELKGEDMCQSWLHDFELKQLIEVKQSSSVFFPSICGAGLILMSGTGPNQYYPKSA
jgi:hypothetical protein